MPVSCSTELLKELNHLRSLSMNKDVLLICGLPDIRPDNWKLDIRFFHIRYPAGYRIAEKWQDFAGYRILNQIYGPSLQIMQ